MKFSTREDIEAPIETVWAAVTDFGGFERQAMRRGAEVQRVDASAEVVLGAAWSIRFPFRGKERQLEAELTALDAPNQLQIDSAGSGIDGGLRAELLELSKNRTRLTLVLEMKPRTIPARVMIQTLRLRKSALTEGFKSRVASFAERISRAA